MTSRKAEERSPVVAVVLDFDGVVLDSVPIKTGAMRALFAKEAPASRDRIVAYHQANGGLSRFVKFRWVYREVLRRPLSPEEEASLGERFSALAFERMLEAPWIQGAERFLERHHGALSLYVASGTPQDELRRVTAARGMDRFFRGVFGSPASKKDILLRIAGESGVKPASLVMVGDSVNDLRGAVDAGARFIGIAADAPGPFPEGAVVLPDLTGLASALRAIGP